MTGQKTKNQAHRSILPERCGIDEAGRGPLAGPVVAAAVILPPAFDTAMLADSKALSERRRGAVRGAILSGGARAGFGWVWPEEIDRINIHHATLLAMRHALDALLSDRSPTGAGSLEVMVDGLYCPTEISVPPGLKLALRAVVGGDGTIPEIMAASILAKTARDQWMIDYALQDDRYGFERHKGYPTRAHRAALLRHGPSGIHRRSFRLL
ncbi:MAG: ribonuclease HII [Spirochaetaceae bacterium]|nr:MAG: ribonuclease HII [Spirochaetaceae bacterium]